MYRPRAFFGNIFGSELLVFSLCVRLVFFGIVLLMFLLYCVALFSRKLPEKILFLSGARFGRNFRERTFGFLPLCPVGVSLVLLCLCFSFIMLPCFPESCLKKNSCQVRVLEDFFCLGVQLVFFGVVLPMFLLYYVALFSRKLPENKILSGARFGRNFRERTFLFLAFVSGWSFWCCFARFSGASPWAW